MLDQIRIVMVETSHPGNIGAAARAMRTMGIRDLRLVDPESFPHPEARARATGAALEVLEHARVCDNLDQALEDATLVVATSARQRRLPWPSLTPREFAALLSDGRAEEKVAVWFGREDRGLTNDELQRCNYHVAIPSDSSYGVLNVAAAVQLICYELRQALAADEEDGVDITAARRHTLTLPQQQWDAPPAASQELEYFLQQFEQLIRTTGFLASEKPDQVVPRLRRLFLRARPDKMEMGILCGALASIEKSLKDHPGVEDV